MIDNKKRSNSKFQGCKAYQQWIQLLKSNLTHSELKSAKNLVVKHTEDKLQDAITKMSYIGSKDGNHKELDWEQVGKI